jgi:hypothetical protein
MKNRKNSKTKKVVTIHHFLLDLQKENKTMFFVLTEMVDYVPVNVFLYKIPTTYFDETFDFKHLEKYAAYCPN